MLTALLTTVLTLTPAPAAQDPVPTADEVTRTVAALEEAFGKGASEDRIKALQQAAQVPDAEVIEWIGKGLRDRDAEVKRTALESLRHMNHPDALTTLHGCYKRDKKMIKDPELGEALLKAIGQHGSVSSIAILADSPYGTPDHGAVQARILGLGNIRSKESVEELMAMMSKASRRNSSAYMGDFRLALMRLTGEDQGKSVDLWGRWWNDAKKKIEVAKEPPRLPKSDQRRWDYYWGNQVQRERDTRRKDRGDDR